MVEDKAKFGAISALAGAAATIAAVSLYSYFKGDGKKSSAVEPKQTLVPESDKLPDEMVAVIGDVGGTNVRLTLRRLCLRTRTSTEIKPLTKINSQGVKNFSEALGQFLSVSSQFAKLVCKLGGICEV